MLQINPFLDCTLYSRIVVHIGQNNQYSSVDMKLVQIIKVIQQHKIFVISLIRLIILFLGLRFKSLYVVRFCGFKNHDTLIPLYERL
jgi:hypothetical protein